MDYMELLRVFHLIGLAFGVGGSVVADSLMGKAVLTNKIDDRQLGMMQHVGSIVTTGLIISVLSGIGFLTVYALTSPELLLNPKLWAKLTVVAILSINGIVLHKVILPFLASRLGQPLFTKQVVKQAHLTMSVGAISFVSWYTALILGSWAAFNFIYSYALIFGIYVAVLTCALIVANLAAWWFARQSQAVKATKAAVRRAAA